MFRQRGLSFIEAVIVLFLIATALLIALPSFSMIRLRGRAAAGARYLAGQLHQLRWESVAQRKGRGFLFERAATGWTWRVVEDGNGNGLRTAEVRRGVDRTLSGPHRLEDRVEHVRLGFPGAGPFPRIPPKRGLIVGTEDPVRFGSSDLVAFTPLGTASSGTLYLTDDRDTMFAVVLFGPTARVRVWRYDVRRNKWTL